MFLLQEGEFNWSNELQGYILGSFFYGYITTQILGGRLAERYGTKWLFGGSVLCTSALSILTPVVARWSPYAFIVLRVLEGIGEVRNCDTPYTYGSLIVNDDIVDMCVWRSVSLHRNFH